MFLQTFHHLIRSNGIQINARGRCSRTCITGYIRCLHNRKNHRGKNKVKARAIPYSKKTIPKVAPMPSPTGDHSSRIAAFSFLRRFIPKITQKEKFSFAMKRFLLSLPLVYFISHEDYSPIPFRFEGMAGPSMIPTIYPTGEIYIHITNWFYKYATTMGSNLNTIKGDSNKSGKNQNNHPWQVGDVVILKDFRGRKACKRIICIEGDRVSILGQYRHLYGEEDGYGILGREQMINQGLPTQWREKAMAHDGQNHTAEDQLIIPKDHVWVEGDNPLYSVDSRFYGPVHESQLLGKVIYRVWPRRRHLGEPPCILSRERPHPIPEKEMFNEKYNLEKSPFVK